MQSCFWDLVQVRQNLMLQEPEFENEGALPRRASSLSIASQLLPGSRFAHCMACSLSIRLPATHENSSAEVADTEI